MARRAKATQNMRTNIRSAYTALLLASLLLTCGLLIAGKLRRTGSAAPGGENGAPPAHAGGNRTVAFADYMEESPSAHPESMVVYVRSAPAEFQLRNALRATWVGHLRTLDTQKLKPVYFAIGRTADHSVAEMIRTENASFGDVIQLNVIDSYRNLSVKTRELFIWHFRHFQNSALLLTNVDGLIFPEGLLKFAGRLRPSAAPNTVYGYCTCTGECAGLGVAWPQRGASDKYYIPHDAWPAPRLPHYCMGYSLVFTPGTVFAILKVALNLSARFLQEFFVDDVLYTGAVRLWSEDTILLDNQINLFRPTDIVDSENRPYYANERGQCHVGDGTDCVAVHVPQAGVLEVKTWWNHYLRVLVDLP